MKEGYSCESFLSTIIFWGTTSSFILLCLEVFPQLCFAAFICCNSPHSFYGIQSSSILFQSFSSFIRSKTLPDDTLAIFSVFEFLWQHFSSQKSSNKKYLLGPGLDEAIASNLWALSECHRNRPVDLWKVWWFVFMSQRLTHEGTIFVIVFRRGC